MSKIGLNQALVDQARASAAHIAADTQVFVDSHTTVTVERAVCRLLGIDGVNEVEVPMPNIVVDHLVEKGLLGKGAAWALGNAMCATGLGMQEIAEAISRGELDLSTLTVHTDAEIRAAVDPVATAMCDRIKKNRATRNAMLESYGGDKEGPYLYLIVATGNIYEDVTQAQAAARQGADVVAVIRTTGQSLLD